MFWRFSRVSAKIKPTSVVAIGHPMGRRVNWISGKVYLSFCVISRAKPFRIMNNAITSGSEQESESSSTFMPLVVWLWEFGSEYYIAESRALLVPLCPRVQSSFPPTRWPTDMTRRCCAPFHLLHLLCSSRTARTYDHRRDDPFSLCHLIPYHAASFQALSPYYNVL